jgi:hypothetical protein
MIDEGKEHRKNDNWQENAEIIGEKIPSVTLSTTNPTWTTRVSAERSR